MGYIFKKIGPKKEEKSSPLLWGVDKIWGKYINWVGIVPE